MDIQSLYAWLFQAYAVLLFLPNAYSSDQSCSDGMRAPVECYECTSYGGLNEEGEDTRYCEDPFNKSHPAAHTVECRAPCAKWIRKHKLGEIQIVRTCSSNLNLRITVALVCMKESQPGDGRLCFCHRNQCNGAISLHNHHVIAAEFNGVALCLVLVALSAVLVVVQFPDYSFVITTKSKVANLVISVPKNDQKTILSSVNDNLSVMTPRVNQLVMISDVNVNYFEPVLELTNDKLAMIIKDQFNLLPVMKLDMNNETMTPEANSVKSAIKVNGRWSQMTLKANDDWWFMASQIRNNSDHNRDLRIRTRSEVIDYDSQFIFRFDDCDRGLWESRQFRCRKGTMMGMRKATKVDNDDRSRGYKRQCRFPCHL